MVNCFFGRSPENIYDFMSGVFDKLEDWRRRLHHVNISMKYYEGYDKLNKTQMNYIKKYLIKCGLHPKQIIQRKRRTCIVDFIYSGNTIDNFTLFMEQWVKSEKLSLADMQNKFEFILIQTKTDFELRDFGEPFSDIDFVNYYGFFEILFI